ncbi:T9SS type A sorting domain-containing protein [Flavobacterium sp. UMI-01]|uniref:T9SS type A sorting domain-containing protein n=1 Tax=Flavobacterium sp. UMI-01 TaxID=1441053 RepID=UPI001C7D0C8C|nr:T9SS type A sorting domain-containing protein [Flavobacterium sp. UMI-01]
MKKLLLFSALVATTLSFAQTLSVTINGKTVDDFLASTVPVNTFPANTPLTIGVSYTNLPVAPSNTQPVGQQARIVFRFYEPASTPGVFKNALYLNGFKESDPNVNTSTFQYTATEEVAGHTLQIFAAGAQGATQTQRFNINVSNSATLSTPSVELNAVGVYPNPTTGNLTLDSNELINGIEVYDLLGKNVKTFKNTNEINISDLNNGTYILKTDNGKIAKIIKQ